MPAGTVCTESVNSGGYIAGKRVKPHASNGRLGRMFPCSCWLNGETRLGDSWMSADVVASYPRMRATAGLVGEYT